MTPPAGFPSATDVRLARERLGLNQRAFATLLGISRQGTISQWERGRVVPSISSARMQELIQGATTGGVRPDLLVDPRLYALAVLEEVAEDARRTLARVAEARRVLGLPEAATVPAAEVALGLAGLAAPVPPRQRKRRGRAR